MDILFHPKSLDSDLDYFVDQKALSPVLIFLDSLEQIFLNKIKEISRLYNKEALERTAFLDIEILPDFLKGVIALLTDQPLLLLIIGFPFVIETLSVIIQIASKKILKRKLLKSAPLHHHLQASGWSEPKIVMRFWMISLALSGVGVAIALVDRF